MCSTRPLWLATSGPRRRMLWVLGVLITAGGCMSPAMAAPYVRIQQTHSECLGSSCRQMTTSWSGVIIGDRSPAGGKSSAAAEGSFKPCGVLTCAHGYRSDVRTRVEMDEGIWLDADVVALDPHRDLGLLVVNSERHWPSLELVTVGPSRGEPVITVAYPGGQPIRDRRSEVLGYWGERRQWLVLAHQFLSGESGGAVVSQRRLTGIIVGNRTADGLAVAASEIEAFLAEQRWLGQRSPSGTPPLEAASRIGPLPESVRSPSTPTLQFGLGIGAGCVLPGCRGPAAPPGLSASDWQRLVLQLEQLERRLARIEATPPPRVVPGPPGPAGRDAAERDWQPTLMRLGALEKRLAELERVELPIQIVLPDGTIKQEQRVPLGDPIRLRLLPRPPGQRP